MRASAADCSSPTMGTGLVVDDQSLAPVQVRRWAASDRTRDEGLDPHRRGAVRGRGCSGATQHSPLTHLSHSRGPITLGRSGGFVGRATLHLSTLLDVIPSFTSVGALDSDGGSRIQIEWPVPLAALTPPPGLGVWIAECSGQNAQRTPLRLCLWDCLSFEATERHTCYHECVNEDCTTSRSNYFPTKGATQQGRQQGSRERLHQGSRHGRLHQGSRQ
jgi:hypothetical protein